MLPPHSWRNMPNRPHGGRLVNRVLEDRERQQWQARAEQLPRLQLNPRQISDVELIGKTRPHGPRERLILIGTRVRELLRDGQELPAGFARPEVAEILRQAYRQKELDGKVPGSAPHTTDQ